MKIESKKLLLFDKATQILLPILTVGGLLLVSLKLPMYGLMLTMTSQVFWFYAAWKAWKQAGQIGIFITTVAMTIVTIIGLINYLFL